MITKNELTDQEKAVMLAIGQQLGLEKDKLTPESDLVDDLNLQTLELADMAAILSQKFGVDINPQDSTEWRSVLDVIRAVTESGVSRKTEEKVSVDDNVEI